MKLNYTSIYSIICVLIYNIKHANRNIMSLVYILSYLLSLTIFILGIFNYLNIYIDIDTIKYLEGLDCPTEIIESTVCNDQSTNSSESRISIGSKFLNLFVNNNNTYCKLPEQLVNSYYIEKYTVKDIVVSGYGENFYSLGVIANHNEAVMIEKRYADALFTAKHLLVVQEHLLISLDKMEDLAEIITR